MQALDLDVPDRPGALADARHALARLAADRVDAAALDSALVVVSELVANANRFAGDGACRLRVVLADQRFRIEVIDSSPLRPDRYRGDPGREAESGRGLVLVGALARRWGSGPHRLGKCVWAELPAPDPRG